MSRLPQPTHYTVALDPDTGCPAAVRAKNYPGDEIAGPLPDNWHPAFFDWQPRHDPEGAWVEMEADRRAALWAAVKAQREAEMAANVTVTIGKRALAFQADDSSLREMHVQWAASQADPDWSGVDWTTAGNASVHLDREGIARVIAAIGARQREIHARSQAARIRIYDTELPLLRSLGEVAEAIQSEEET